jgi:hypothetical protein
MCERLSPEESKSKKLDVGQRFTECEIDAGRLTDDKGRATFEGFLQTKDGEKHSCRLALVKEVNSWRVDLFTLQR